MESALECIFISILAIYGMSAAASAFLHRKDRVATILPNLLNIFASATGILFSILFLFNETVQKWLSDPGQTIKALNLSWESNIQSISIQIHIDALSAFFILIISLLSLIVSIYSLGYLKQFFGKRNLGYFGFLYNIFILSMILVVSAGHLFFFLMVWEVMSVVSYFLVVYEGEKGDTQKAGVMYIVMTHIGTAFILAAFILLFKYTGTADITKMNPDLIPNGVKNLVFAFTLIGFGTKAGVIPLHVWLPMAHPAAPSNVSALMSGVMIKTAVYGLIRVLVGILGAQYAWWGTIILVVGAVSTILGISYALMEIDIKRLLAYSSVENMGIILIGLGISIMAYSGGNHVIAAFAMVACLFHVFNHSLFKGLLFMGAGSVHYATGTKNMEKLGGLIKRMPKTAIFFLAGALAISSLPPLNGFVSEWLTYQSIFVNIGIQANWLKIILVLAAAILAMAGVLAAFSFIKTYGISFLAMPRSNNAKEAKEVPKSMLTAMALPTILCVVIGVLPVIMIRVIDQVNILLMDQPVMDKMKGVSSFLLLPVSVDRSSISPLALVAVAAVLVPILFYFIAFVKLKTKVRVYKTWDCGYPQLNSKMQYTATGFSKPIRILFRAIFKPQRELELEEGGTAYFFKSAQYRVSIQSVFEKYLYEPVIKNMVGFAHKARYLIQTGSIHTYLIYIFIVIIAMFIYFIKA